jgi:hypothetical protein
MFLNICRSSIRICQSKLKFSKVLVSTRQYTQWPMIKEEHIMISDLCKNFAETELKPIASENDKEHRYLHNRFLFLSLIF